MDRVALLITIIIVLCVAAFTLIRLFLPECYAASG